MDDEREKPTRRESEKITAPEGRPPERKKAPPIGGYLGETLGGRYKITQKVGEGGMGAVYLGEHVRIEKKVAIKVLTTQRNREYLSRFAQEAKSASKIGHENIVDITDFGDTDDGALFLVMEFLEGADLGRQIRKQGPQPIARCVRIMNQVCSALGAAHQKGIIHRDLKPDNVFIVERRSRPDFVKVLDFGLARHTDVPEGQRITVAGTILGTPEYMAPEQVRGDIVDGRADVYSAGCMLYEMLTGDVPFRGAPYMLVLAQHLQHEPEPPSQFNKSVGITPELDAVVLKALAKSPDDRFQTMKDFALALCAATGTDARQFWSEGANIPATVVVPPPAPSTPGASLVVPRSRAPLWLAAAIGLAALFAVGFFAARGPAPKPPVAQPPPFAPPPPIAVAPAGVAPPPPAVVAPPVKSRQIITSTPPDAEVKRGAERLGRTPLTLELTSDTAPFELLLSRHGYGDASFLVEPARDHEYSIRLNAQARPARPIVEPARPQTTVKPSDPTQKPSELKDVFSE